MAANSTLPGGDISDTDSVSRRQTMSPVGVFDAPTGPRLRCPLPNAPKAPRPKMLEPRRHSRTRSPHQKRLRRESPGPRRDRSRSLGRERRRECSRSPARADSYVPPGSSRLSSRRRSVSDYYRPNYDKSPEKGRKLPQERMREAFDSHDKVKMKSPRVPEPQANVLLHTPVLSYDNQSEDGFMDLDTLIASEAQTVAGAISQSEVVGIHPDRLRRLSNDMDMDDDTPAPEPFVPEGRNAFPVEPRASKLQTSSFASPAPRLPKTGMPAPGPRPSYSSTPATMRPGSMAAASSDLDPWGSGGEVVPSASSYGATLAPPPRLPPPAMPRPPPVPVDLRSRQEIFNDFCQKKDNMIHEDAKRRAANGTLPYTVCEEEMALILQRMSFRPSAVALAIVDYSAKPGESFLKHKSDERFFIKTPRRNKQGNPLTTMDEETTFHKINELGRRTIQRIVETKPGPEKLVSRFERKAKRTPSVLPPVAQKEKNKENIKEGRSQLSVLVSSSLRQKDAEADVLRDIGIDVEMEL